jgi:hypothetical protein
MALHLIVDGYNLLWGGRGAGLGGRADLEADREGLIEELRRYKRTKGFRISLVFDGARVGHGPESRVQKGIHLLFTHGGEKADDAIVRLVRAAPSGTVVVTSDRALADQCRGLGAAIVSSASFQQRLAAAWIEEVKGEPGEGDEPQGPSRGRRKRGISHRVPRSARRDRDRLRRL